MQVEDKITKFLNPLERINDRLIYIADIHCKIMRVSELKKQEEKRKFEIVILKNQVYESKPSEFNIRYFYAQWEIKCNLKESQQMEIIKVVLKQELGCSIYE